ncbi:ATP-binding protein [Streptomyces candidus]|uniref:Signal transduction histidine kinase n=1 Tax=Streptomyces candidus TaxID=67283 RepID=A0A7X0HH50_9ACTN|nr:ATP-binding protein [Streptomyces candidus]MBB6437556.1 signal transduction histidine kinase [Streptomyces candidus]GHH53841.1 hypothetical protein GCM10018773_55960 [Streptomyces candidus]
MNHPHRLLPWTGEGGRPCYLSTDGAGPLTRYADRIEALQLGLAAKLHRRAREALDSARAVGDEDTHTVRQLTDALGDALRIAECRRKRLDRPEGPLLAAVRATHPHSPDRLALLGLPGTVLSSAPAARQHVRATARAWGVPGDVVDTLETVTGELVANALEHGDSWEVAVTLTVAEDRVTVGVTDEGRDAAAFTFVRAEPGPEQEHGGGC